MRGIERAYADPHKLPSFVFVERDYQNLTSHPIGKSAGLAGDTIYAYIIRQYQSASLSSTTSPLAISNQAFHRVLSSAALQTSAVEHLTTRVPGACLPKTSRLARTRGYRSPCFSPRGLLQWAWEV